MVVDPNGNTRQVKVGLNNGKPAFTNGVRELVAFYSLTERALFNFEFILPLTFNIRIFAYHGPEIQYPRNENVPEVIILDSDSDSDSDSDTGPAGEPNIQWEKVVTDKYVRGRVPLVSSTQYLFLFLPFFTLITQHLVAPPHFMIYFHLIVAEFTSKGCPQTRPSWNDIFTCQGIEFKLGCGLCHNSS